MAFLDDTGAEQQPLAPAFEKEPKNLGVLCKMVDDSFTTFSANTQKRERDRNYYDGVDQLDAETIQILNKRNQPPVVFNMIDLAVDGILGVIQSTPTDPRAWPRSPGDDDSADVATKLLRYCADLTRLDDKKIELGGNLVIEGDAAVHIGVRERMDRRRNRRYVEPTLEVISPDEFFFDPFSRQHDFKDATYMGIAKWMDWSALRNLYGDSFVPPEVTGYTNGVIGMSTPEDRPETAMMDINKRRAMLVELYYTEYDEYGEKVWYRCVFTSEGVLESAPAGYEDDRGQSICPIQAISCRIDRKNNRYGLVRGMIHAQDEINSRRSRSLYLMNANRTQYLPDPNGVYPIIDEAIIRREAAKSDGVLPPGVQMISNSELAQGQVLLLNDAREFIGRRAASPAVLGRVDEAVSGRAKLVDQQAGLTELAITLARLGDLENRVYRHFWYIAQQFMDEPMMINVTGDADVVEHIQINEPVIEPRPTPVMGMDGQPVMDPYTGQPVMEMKNQVVGINKQLAMMDMNITVQSVPQSPNLQSETFEQVLQLLQSGLPIESPQFEMLVELAPIQDKSRLRDLIKQGKDAAEQAQQAQAQQQAQMMAEAQQLTTDKAKAGIAKDISHAQKAEADANYKATETALLQAQMGYQPGLVPMNGQYPNG